MDVRIVEQKKISGLTIRTDNATEMDPTTGQIGPLWQRFDNTVPVDYQHGERVYGVYSDYESDHNGKFTVLAGYDGKNLPQDLPLETITIEAGKYLVFTHKGEMPQIAIDAWTQVWQYFTNDDAEHHRRYSTDFEFYPYNNEIQVHIAIK